MSGSFDSINVSANVSTQFGISDINVDVKSKCSLWVKQSEVTPSLLLTKGGANSVYTLSS